MVTSRYRYMAPFIYSLYNTIESQSVDSEKEREKKSMDLVEGSDGRRSSELKTNKILVRALHKTGKAYHDPTEEPLPSYSVFHEFDVNTGEISTLDPLLFDHNIRGYMVRVESRIYVIGRLLYTSDEPRPTSTYIHRALSFLDLRQLHHGWREAPVMAPQPLAGDCVSLCGNIYAFRGSYGSCVCEVFDPLYHHWLHIKSPPLPSQAQAEIRPPVIADTDNNRILVYYGEVSTLFAYYPDKDEWEALDHSFCGWDEEQRNEAVFADGIIYVHDSGWKNRNLRAYHVSRKKWFKVTLPSGFQSSQHCCFNFLNYMGQGLLCLLSFPVENSTTTILVHQLKVDLQNDPEEVLVTSISLKTYKPLDSVFNVHHCLPIPIQVTLGSIEEAS